MIKNKQTKNVNNKKEDKELIVLEKKGRGFFNDPMIRQSCMILGLPDHAPRS